MRSEICEAVAVQLYHRFDLASVHTQFGFLPHELCGGVETTWAVIHSFELLTELSLSFDGSVVFVIGRFIKSETVIECDLAGVDEALELIDFSDELFLFVRHLVLLSHICWSYATSSNSSLST